MARHARRPHLARLGRVRRWRHELMHQYLASLSTGAMVAGALALWP